MNITQIIEELRQQRDQIEEAIISLERLARGGAPRRGRPPAWLAASKKGKKKKGTPAADAK